MAADAMIRMSIGLVLVILAILACAWLARRSGLGTAGQAAIVKEVDSLRAGPRHRISVLEVDGTWIVVAHSPTGTTLLHTQAAGSSTVSIPPADLPGFARWLHKAQTRRSA